MRILKCLALVSALLVSTTAWAQISSIELVSKSDAGIQGDSGSDGAVISSGGDVVAYRSGATNLVSGDSNNRRDVFVFNVDNDSVERVSVTDIGVQGNGDSGEFALGFRPIAIDTTGNLVCFSSDATNFMATADTNGVRDVFVYDRSDGDIDRRSIRFSSLQGTLASEGCSVADDDDQVTFGTLSTFSNSSDLNGGSDIFLRSEGLLDSGLVSIVSGNITGDGASSMPSMSSDGRFIVFKSAATDLVAGDTNGTTDIFLFDATDDSIKRISVSTSDVQANGDCDQPYISPNGDFVVFTSAASNLDARDTDTARDVFLYDRNADTLEVVSLGRTGKAANGSSSYPNVSNDGRYVAFLSTSTNIVAGDGNNSTDAFIRDNITKTNLRVNLKEDGKQAAGNVTDLAIDDTGRYAVFSSTDSTLVSGDTNSASDVFLVEFAPVVTPDTPITEGPATETTDTTLTVTMQKFSKASNKSISSTGQATARATRRRKRVEFIYQIDVEGQDNLAGQNRRRNTKRNEFTFRNLAAGTYKVNYRVIVKKGRRRIGNTNTSPDVFPTVG